MFQIKLSIHVCVEEEYENRISLLMFEQNNRTQKKKNVSSGATKR